MKLRAPGSKPITLDPVRPSAGMEAWYRGQLMTLIKAMHKSVTYWVLAAVRAEHPELAEDGSLMVNPAFAEIESVTVPTDEEFDHQPVSYIQVGQLSSMQPGLDRGHVQVLVNRGLKGSNPIYVVQSVDGLVVIDGNHRVEAARQLGHVLIAARIVDRRLAGDKAPTLKLTARLKRLGKQWGKQFDDMSGSIAKGFADGVMKHNDLAFKHALKKGGFSVKFKPSPVVQKQITSIVSENVDLIKSIPQEYLAGVKKRVRKSVAAGRRLKELTAELEEVYGVAHSRAILISQDQNNKATAHIHRARQKELGLTTAKWSHTMASKDPRVEHEEFDGELYDVDEGMWSEVDGEFVWPGTPINCGCTSRTVIPGFDDDEDEEE